MSFRPRITGAVEEFVNTTANQYGMKKQAAARFLIALGRASINSGVDAETMLKAVAESGSCLDPTRAQQGSTSGSGQGSNGGSTLDPSVQPKSNDSRPKIGTGIEISAFQQQQDAECVKRLGSRLLAALRSGHGSCCLDDWEQANVPSIARRAVRAGALGEGQRSKVEEALDKANACELAKRGTATTNVPSAAAQRAKALEDLKHHKQVMRERAEDGLPVTEEMRERLKLLRAVAGTAGEET